MKSKKTPKKPFISGILGVQGAGKTTFTKLIKKLGENENLSIQVFSIDDFYLTLEERQLLFEKDNRFLYRGPPGTHDNQLLKQVLESLEQGKVPIEVPIFDKSVQEGKGDRVGFEKWEKIPDLVLFEGWFVGLQGSGTELRYLKPLQDENDMKFAEDCREIQKNMKFCGNTLILKLYQVQQHLNIVEYGENKLKKR
ncbi:hypothetical protein IMG5_163630 [Ichthyophthirius multifiliis]|uniref:Phosphoribulokinase/uridine kinase domain-containing protein n=1 Tax=Ichthyophthirius multifiliis TaxID=5932 RepID=G0R0D6_ICHMU|nr:hypothetical protein IMG5_163630 [Ichthyophthirius multifiliis]EGR29073.1 hypothetical protein IMG5_163630 [Ichthyophthirius multifiliis]|eukprot:XP_004030309.1 hypothetical protein IMG5_163630 [Ichthyophthirius multifiliis]